MWRPFNTPHPSPISWTESTFLFITWSCIRHHQWTSFLNSFYELDHQLRTDPQKIRLYCPVIQGPFIGVPVLWYLLFVCVRWFNGLGSSDILFRRVLSSPTKSLNLSHSVVDLWPSWTPKCRELFISPSLIVTDKLSFLSQRFGRISPRRNVPSIFVSDTSV